MADKTDKVVFQLVPTNVYLRFYCHLCGGSTEKDSVVCEVTSGPYKGMRACPECLRAGADVDKRIQAHIQELEEEAAELREVIGRLSLPTYGEWEAAANAEEDMIAKAYEEE